MAIEPLLAVRVNAVLAILSQYDALGFELPAHIADKRARLSSTAEIATMPSAEEIANVSAADVPALLERVAYAATLGVAEVKMRLANVIDSFRVDLFHAANNDIAVLYDAVAAELSRELGKLTDAVTSTPYSFAVNPGTWDRQDKSALAGLKKLRAEFPTVTPLVALLTSMIEHMAPVRLDASKPELQAVAHLIPFYSLSHLKSPQLAELAKNLPRTSAVSIETATYLVKFDVYFAAHSLAERTKIESELNAQAMMFTEQDGRLIPASEARELPNDGGWPTYSGATIL